MLKVDCNSFQSVENGPIFLDIKEMHGTTSFAIDQKCRQYVFANVWT
jgi:hypothetical protein